jgi:hypothetical protein
VASHRVTGPEPRPSAWETGTLHVAPWQGVPLHVDAAWFDLRGDYVEHHWLPVMGPTSTFLLRRIGEGFAYAPDGFDLDVAETSRSLGVAWKGGRNAPLPRAGGRLVAFRLAYWENPDTLRVYRRAPAVPHSYRDQPDTRCQTVIDG